MGTAVAVLCFAGLVKIKWLITQTPKGQKLVKHFGEENALHLLRLFLILGILFGSLLATGIINPIQWD